MRIIEQILHLNVLLGSVVLMVITATAGLGAYLVSNRLLGRSQSKDTRRTANYLFRAIAVLVSLFLSLTFADVMLEMNQIESSIEREAVMLEDIYRDLGRYESGRAVHAQKLVVDYIDAVIRYDWPALADDRLSREAREIFLQLEYEVLHLDDRSEIQGILRSRIVSDVDAVSDLRLSRLEQALAKPPLFLVVVIFGFLITMVCFGPHEPTRSTLALLSLYTLLVGLVIYLILAYSDPFQGATGIEPASLEYVLEQTRSRP